MNYELGACVRIDGVHYFYTLNAAGVYVWISENGNVYDVHPASPTAKQLGKIVASGDIPIAEQSEPDLTPEQIYEAAIRDNNENLRWWKEGYAEGYKAGFDAGREYQLEQ